MIDKINIIRFILVLSFVSSLMSDVLAAYEPFEVEAIKVTNTIAVDVNAAGTNQFNNINTTAVINTEPDVFTSVTTNGVFCIPGTYLVDVSLYHTGGSGRNNPSVEITVNSVGTGVIGADGYVRRASGHDEASTTVSDLVRFTTISKIGFQTTMLSSGGAVVAPAGQSVMRIVRVDD